MGRPYPAAEQNPHRMLGYPAAAYPETFYCELPGQPGTLFYPPSPSVALDSGLFELGTKGSEPPPYSTVWGNWGPLNITDPDWPLASWLANITVYRSYFGVGPFITVEVVLLTASFPQPNPERIWRATYWAEDTPTGVPGIITVQEFISSAIGEVRAYRYDQMPP